MAVLLPCLLQMTCIDHPGVLFTLAQIWREVQSSFHCSELEGFTLSLHDAVAEPARPWPMSQTGMLCADSFFTMVF